MLPPNLARALAKGTVMSCFHLLLCVLVYGRDGVSLKADPYIYHFSKKKVTHSHWIAPVFEQILSKINQIPPKFGKIKKKWPFDTKFCILQGVSDIPGARQLILLSV